jgi:hypothetical protein
MSSKKGQPTGYKYMMDIHMGLCRGPIDSFCHIVINTNCDAWHGNVVAVDTANTGDDDAGTITLTINGNVQNEPNTGNSFQINQPNLFGGDTAEGGIVGTVFPLFGFPNQVIPNFMKNHFKKNASGVPSPEFRGLTTLYYTGEVASNNPYLKPWKVRCRRALNGWYQNTPWYPAKAVVPMAAARIIFYYNPLPGEILTFNGIEVTYGSTDGPYALATQDTPAHNAAHLMEYLNNNTSIFGLIATAADQEFNSDEAITVTQYNPVIGGAPYVIKVTPSSDNPDNIINNPTLNGTVNSSSNATNFGVEQVTLQSGSILAMNGAHILYELCTNPTWGRGLPATMMDNAAFMACADTLYGESFGLCLKWSQQDSLGSFAQHVIETIGAAMYISRSTGLMTLKLLRQDYTASDLPHFGPNSGLLSVDDDTSAQPTSFNQIIVTYHDPIQDVDLQVRVQNLSSYKANQASISQTTEYKGIPIPALAAQVAQRDLRQQAAGLKRYTIKLDQSGRILNPGDVFTFSDPTRNISNIVMRVGKAEFGTPVDRTVTVTCLQDIFGLPDTTYLNTQPTGWNASPNTPAACTARAAFEATYRDLYYYLPSATFASFPATSGAVSTLAQNPGITSPGYDIGTGISPAAPVATSYRAGYAPGGSLTAAMGVGDTSFVLNNPIDTRNLPPAPFAMLIDGEWVNCTAIDLTSYTCTIARGCLDTVPVAHLAGASVFCADYFENSDYEEYTTGEVVGVQMLTITSQGILSETLAPIDDVTIAARWNMPYPPGLVSVQGESYWLATSPVISSDIVLTWASRNRITQQDVMIDQTAASVTAEAGTTYNITVTFNGAVVRTVTGLTALTWTYTLAEQEADGIEGNTIIGLQSERGGVTSYTSYAIPLIIYPTVGWGSDWGGRWGE